MERHLAAILAADVVGYTRLMEKDEADTYARLRSHRKELFEPKIAQHNGRVFKLMGDGLLAEFGSVVDAVECAVDVQRGMAERNGGVVQDRRIDCRIGINLGDVILEGDDRHGDGVNIAARLQQLADPGGICVSQTVFNHVKHKVALRFEPRGEERLKNIAEPVAVYRVLADSTAARPPPLKWLAAVGRHQLPAAALTILLLSGAGAAAWYMLPHGSPPANKPGIAVLPFDNKGGDEVTARLADGITEDIITDLARFRDLDVIARNSTAVYKDKAVDVRQMGRELNVGYVLEGSIQRQGTQIRVTAQLIDTATGAHLWSERWNRPDKDIFAIQTELAAEVAGTLGGISGSSAITAEEIRKAKRRPPTSLTAYDYYLLANEGRTLFTKELVTRGLEDATKAISLDPNFGRAYVARAWLNYITVHYGSDFETAMQAMEADARRAIELDPHDAEARAALAFLLSGRGRFIESEAEAQLAVQDNPANAQVLAVVASMHPWNGNPEEGAQLADRALRLDPWMTTADLNSIKDAYFFARRFEDTIALISRIPENARGRGSRLLLTLSYALLGRDDEAARARADLLAKYPSISAELLINQDWVFARPEEENLLFDGFRAAGISLCASDADLAKNPKPRRLPECVKP